MPCAIDKTRIFLRSIPLLDGFDNDGVLPVVAHIVDEFERVDSLTHERSQLRLLGLEDIASVV